LPGQKGCGKALQEILKRLEWKYPELDFQRTPTNKKYATSEEALAALASHEFVDSLLKFQEVQKLLAAFVNKMGRRRLHPSFDVLKTTGRTSSFGEINAQNLPRDDRVRSCFWPADGHVFLDADYATIEMATLAQSVQAQFDLKSKMAKAINSGTDLHRLVASRVARKSQSRITDEERQKAKPINFGKPGGMGNVTLKAYAKANYKVTLDDDEVQALSDSWFELFPEMEAFLGGDDLGKEIARVFNLTPATYFDHTGSRKFLDHPANQGRAEQPHAILGAMCLKVLKTSNPETQDGRAYDPEELDFFWTRVAANLEGIPGEFHQAIRDRQASVRLQRGIMRSVGRAGVFTLTGRLRAKASYCARHNTVFQGLAADGAKLGLWHLWRAGFRIVNFIHDEVLVEVPVRSNLAHQAEMIRYLMVKGMKSVVPDVRVDVEYAASERWYKKAKLVLDQKRGNMVAWQPANV
jgi:DNA polymerase I-like protein with 3'-5' exonuclease and polymerase domains